MENIGKGHWIFAGFFVVIFVAAMVFAYRRDLKFLTDRYRGVGLILLGIIVIYLIIYYLFTR